MEDKSYEELTEKLGIEKQAVDKEFNLDDIVEKEVEFDLDEHINETLEQKMEAEQPVEKPKKKAKKIDISKITIKDSNPIEREKDLINVLYGGKTVFQIVAAQSGYMAKMRSLVNKDYVSLLFSTETRYEYRRSVYKVIYDKIAMFSCGNMTFEEWLRNTTVEDLETFYFGIYCSTFPNEGSFTFTCPNPECRHQETIKINHNSLIKTTDKAKMKKLINDVSKNATSIEAMKKYSLIGKNEHYQLEDSGIIAELRTPSLQDSLDILRTVPESVIDRDQNAVTNMLYVKKFLIPTPDGAAYTEQVEPQEILRIIDNLTIDDANMLEDAIADRVDENRITYSIKNIKCQKCQKEATDIPVTIEDILFTLIFEKANQ